ncbi:copper resistance protein CopD [Shewanella sp. 202IG2-18]|uniref:copper resistance protein CopD n=1 Tax=Parashewanella hymeniacidonis TaxID=2807618 RepID=UPI00195F2E82|nr:copper resistance protein CopD [Parashewanella hymeniacidonis]MBM7072518.1 copper resistance protein CopD [Parashewanella hymeniacidonis]
MYTVALTFHLLAATVWTGGHIVLATTILPYSIRHKDLAFIKLFENCYEKIGIPALIIQISTGLYLMKVMTPDGVTLFDFSNPISKLISYKLILLLLTAILAIDARLRVIPKLSEKTLWSLAWHIIPVTIISILFALVGLSFRTGLLR